MRSRLEILVDLLHSQDTAALATQSAVLPGFPLATAVAFAADANHQPVLLISALAEHTRNLAADPKAGLLVAKALGGGEMARASLVGEVVPVDAERPLVDRYLRYHPEAVRFLQLGDFSFHRFEPRRALVVGGFAQASWLDGKALLEAPSLAYDVEAALLEAAPATGMELLGLDCYGIDVRDNGTRRRIAFDTAPVAIEALPATIARHLAAQK